MFKHKYSYKAKVTCVDGQVKEVEGVSTFESEAETLTTINVGTAYLLKCQILHDRFKPGEAVGTDNVELLESKCLGIS